MALGTTPGSELQRAVWCPPSTDPAQVSERPLLVAQVME